MTDWTAQPSRVRVALAGLRDAIAGAGVPASLDPQTVQVPGAWIAPQWIDELTMTGGARLVTHVYLIAPAVGTLEVLDILGNLLDAALPVIEPSTEEGDRLDTNQAVTLPANPTTALPAFRLITHLTMEGTA